MPISGKWYVCLLCSFKSCLDPSLASNGIMHRTSKSDLLECLEPLVQHPESIPKVDVGIFDGAALVHLLDPHKSSIPVMTFRDYSQMTFLPYKKHMLQGVVRVNVVCNIYRISVKTQTRQAVGVVIISGLITPLRFLQSGRTFFIVMQIKTTSSSS